MTSTVTARPGAQRWTTIVDGGRLRQLRREHGLSQEQLATHAGDQPDHHPPPRTPARLTPALL